MLSLELASFITLKHVYQTSIGCLLRPQVVLHNDLPIFHEGQLSLKCVQIYVQPQQDDTCQYSISYSYFENIINELSPIQNFPLIEYKNYL